jgi:hypothetical protein
MSLTPSTRFIPALGRRVVLEQWKCYGFTIEEGFETDGATSILKDDRAEAAGVLHDWLVTNRDRLGLTLSECRSLFLQKLKDDGTSPRRLKVYQIGLWVYDHLPRLIQRRVRRSLSL